MINNQIRVRFAPSPTGPLHIGGVRTALFNYLFAKKHSGTFVLRIEDTDQTRYVPGAEDYIKESFAWCGLEFDESPDKGGKYAPYRQSERKEIYADYAKKLLESGNAYYAFDTPGELEAMRERLKEQKSKNQQYSVATRNSMKNSLTLTESEVEQRIQSGEPYVVRFKMPENQELVVKDIIRGDVHFNTSDLDDKVLFKSDGMPTYHLANIVDDHLMKISHVIRGEEWLPSLPLHVMLYRALSWSDQMPQFAHLPLILKPTGKGKLSKRDGEKMGFPVFPLQWKDPETGEIAAGYRESGYFPDAFLNILAFLGWNPGTEQELFALEELAQAFSLEKVGKSGARFDPEKAKWFNHQYLQKKSDEDLADLFQKELKKRTIEAPNDFVKQVCALTKERVNFVAEIWEQAAYFFQAPTEYTPKVVKKQWKTQTPEILGQLRGLLSEIEDFSSENLETQVKNWITEKEIGFGKVMNPLRLVLVGGAFGVHLFDIMALIGKQETLKRIDRGLEKIKK